MKILHYTEYYSDLTSRILTTISYYASEDRYVKWTQCYDDPGPTDNPKWICDYYHVGGYSADLFKNSDHFITCERKEEKAPDFVRMTDTDLMDRKEVPTLIMLLLLGL